MVRDSKRVIKWGVRNTAATAWSEGGAVRPNTPTDWGSYTKALRNHASHPKHVENASEAKFALL